MLSLKIGGITLRIPRIFVALFISLVLLSILSFFHLKFRSGKSPRKTFVDARFSGKDYYQAVLGRKIKNGHDESDL